MDQHDVEMALVGTTGVSYFYYHFLDILYSSTHDSSIV